MRIPLKSLTLSVVLGLASQAAMALDSISLPWVNSNGRTTYSTADHPTGIFVVEFSKIAVEHVTRTLPKVDALAASYRSNSRVQVLNIGIDRVARETELWISRHKPNHPVLSDANRAVMNKLGVTATPTTFVFNCRMEEQWKHRGAWSAEDEAALRRVISRLASESCRR